MVSKLCIVWFRKDLRLSANPALLAAAHAGYEILPLYIEDTTLQYQSGAALNVFKHHALKFLLDELKSLGSKLFIAKGDGKKVLSEIVRETKAAAVYWNRLYEPDAIARDTELKTLLAEQGLEVKSFNSSLLLEPWELLNKQDLAYKVFTAYHKRHSEIISERALTKQYAALDLQVPKFSSAKYTKSLEIDDLELLPKIQWHHNIERFWEFGKKPIEIIEGFVKENADDYPDLRNRPDLQGVSKLSPYLALGLVSPQMIYSALLNSGLSSGKKEYIRQLVWRDFAYHLIYHMPILVTEPQRPEFKKFPWHNFPDELQAWQKGLTGYPIVDAGMRELWSTGWMHNRVRMIVASFLVKDLLIDWREGAKWFWDTLVDADLANNTMGWQWAAGCGVDAAPYFRIFNPILQGEKFDPDGAYVRRWIPEIAKLDNKWIQKPFLAPASALRDADIELGKDYPQAIVDHGQARERALAIFKNLK